MDKYIYETLTLWRNEMARDFANGWSGLKEYAVKVGLAEADDGDDVVAAKIKAVIQGTLPEEDSEEEAEETEGGEGTETSVGRPPGTSCAARA